MDDTEFLSILTDADAGLDPGVGWEAVRAHALTIITARDNAQAEWHTVNDARRQCSIENARLRSEIIRLHERARRIVATAKQWRTMALAEPTDQERDEIVNAFAEAIDAFDSMLSETTEYDDDPAARIAALTVERDQLRHIVDIVNDAFVRHDDERWCIAHGALVVLADALDALESGGTVPGSTLNYGGTLPASIVQCRCGTFFSSTDAACPSCGTCPRNYVSPFMIRKELLREIAAHTATIAERDRLAETINGVPELVEDVMRRVRTDSDNLMASDPDTIREAVRVALTETDPL